MIAGRGAAHDPSRLRLLRFPTAVRRDPAIDAWMRDHPAEPGEIARRWFEALRRCGDDVRELLHDGHPTASMRRRSPGSCRSRTRT